MSASNLTTLVGDATSTQEARRIRASRDAAVQCCAPGWLEEAFGPQILILPSRLEAGATDEQHERYRLEVNLARAASAQDNVARLRGAFWAEVALRGALSRNRGDEEVQRALRMLRGLLNDEWPAPSVTAKQLELFGVAPVMWQAWAADAETPATVPQRYAVAWLHVSQALSAPTSLHSRGRQSDIFDPPRRAYAEG